MVLVIYSLTDCSKNPAQLHSWTTSLIFGVSLHHVSYLYMSSEGSSKTGGMPKLICALVAGGVIRSNFSCASLSIVLCSVTIPYLDNRCGPS